MKTANHLRLYIAKIDCVTADKIYLFNFKKNVQYLTLNNF